jgi:hypothetical protein
MSPTARSLKTMRDRGYTCFVVEHYNSFMRKRVDLAGFIDILCFGDNEVVGIQATSGSNVSARVKKITDHANVAVVRKAGVGILVHGWTKGKNGRYSLREVDIS